MKTAPEILQVLEDKFPGKIIKSERGGIDPYAVVEPGALLEICVFLKDDPAFAFDSLMCLSGVDYKGLKGEPERIEVVYHLFSMQHRHAIVLKVQLPRENPSVATLETIWAIANWHEREAYDMFGIRFEEMANEGLEVGTNPFKAG